MKNATLLLIFLLVSGFARGQFYWNKVVSGTNHNLLSVSFGSDQVGYIGGADSLLLKTTDGGNTWSKVQPAGMQFSNLSRDIVHINFLDTDTGYALVGNFLNPAYVGAQYVTHNGGVQWHPISPGNIVARSTYFKDLRNGFLVGSAFFAGSTLQPIVNGSFGMTQNFSWMPDDFLYGIDCRGTACIASGSGGYFYRSFDGGIVWDTIKTFNDSIFHAVRFINDSTLVAATDDPTAGVMFSTDTGRTWQTDLSMLTFFYPQLKTVIISKKDSFLIAGKVQMDTTGIVLWYEKGMANNQTVEQALNGAAMRNDSVGFLVGNHGFIASNKQIMVGINSAGSVFNSLRIYPNPTNGIFTTTMNEAHTVKLMDLAGRIVFLDVKPATSHSIDVRGVAKGIYLLEVATEKFSGIEKILLQ